MKIIWSAAQVQQNEGLQSDYCTDPKLTKDDYRFGWVLVTEGNVCCVSVVKSVYALCFRFNDGKQGHTTMFCVFTFLARRWSTLSPSNHCHLYSHRFRHRFRRHIEVRSAQTIVLISLSCEEKEISIEYISMRYFVSVWPVPSTSLPKNARHHFHTLTFTTEAYEIY